MVCSYRSDSAPRRLHKWTRTESYGGRNSSSSSSEYMPAHCDPSFAKCPCLLALPGQPLSPNLLLSHALHPALATLPGWTL